jgi:hypothetical protein
VYCVLISRGTKAKTALLGLGEVADKFIAHLELFSWLLETFQTTFSRRFVSNFESPTTKFGSPITQLDSPITKPEAPNPKPSSGKGNGEPNLCNGRIRIGN